MAKIYIFLIALLALVVLVSGCIGGDKKEDTPLTGAAVGTPSEETTITSSCSDDNVCTTDTFNELTKTCEHKATDSCCGNDKCEEGERCDAATQETICPKDCSLLCPANLVVHKPGEVTQTANAFICGNSINCELIGDNSFRISEAEKATITATITNIGERASTVISSKFYCGSNEGTQIMYDGEVLGGITFKDYFENYIQDKIEYLNAQQSGDNSVAYILEIDSSDRASIIKEITCKIMIMSEDFTKSQDIKLKFE